MRFETVCDNTGLPDRAVSYYIDKKLLSPPNSEYCYKNQRFDFTQENVQQLKDIGVLRKAGFTVNEIKVMLTNLPQILPTVQALQQRKQANGVEDEALQQVDESCCHTAADLAAQLAPYVEKVPLPREDSGIRFANLFLPLLKKLPVFIITWFPVALSVVGAFEGISADAFPVFSPKALIILLIALLPSSLIVTLPNIKLRRTFAKHARRILLVLCVLSIPFSFIASVNLSSRSETTDFRNYRDFDPDCLANRDSFFQELFPLWPNYFDNVKQPDGNYATVYLDAHYLYRKLPAIDYTYDIYAQWPLEKEEFDKEVARVMQLYDAEAEEYAVIQKGNYTCLISYYGDPPFAEATDNYEYNIFAYDETTLTVRYISCVSLENGADQPYYLSLDW